MYFRFSDDVVLSYNGAYSGVMLAQQHRCNVVHAKTLLRGNGCMLYTRRRRASRLEESTLQGVRLT